MLTLNNLAQLDEKREELCKKIKSQKKGDFNAENDENGFKIALKRFIETVDGLPDDERQVALHFLFESLTNELDAFESCVEDVLAEQRQKAMKRASTLCG